MTIVSEYSPLLKVDVTPLNRQELLREMGHAVDSREQMLVVGHNLHSVYLHQTDSAFREAYGRASVRLADGMPVLAAMSFTRLIRLQPPLPVTRRLGSTDWVQGCVGLPQVRRVALLGASTASNAGAAQTLSDQAPGTEFLSLPADPWRDADLGELVQTLRGFDPDVLLVGMGMPLQERVITELRDQLSVPVVAAVGGALDQLSGTQPLAPRWLGRMGLEWAWRLASNPRRLSHRYLVEPMHLALLLLRRTA